MIDINYKFAFAEGHLYLEMDVGSSQSVNQALSAAIDSYKRPPSVIVNSAGITRDGFLLKMSEDDFDSVINVNLKVSKNIIKEEVQVGVGWDGQGVPLHHR